MKKFFKKWTVLLMLAAITISPTQVRADFWGGDVVVLSQILAQAIEQLASLREIFGTNQDTLKLLDDVNKGISDAMNMVQTMNSTIHMGQFGNINDLNQLLRTIQDLYGMIPKTSEAKVQTANDQGATEAIMLHNEAFQYASEIDPVAERIKNYAKDVSPQGAAKLSSLTSPLLPLRSKASSGLFG